MCTALVVREEYWDNQFRVYLKLRGITLSQYQLEKVKVIITDFSVKVAQCLKEIADMLVDVFGQIFIYIKATVYDTLATLSKFVDECEITPKDGFETVCDKLENRTLYLNRQNCIKQEQYYKSQFKLAKMNYNVMNHDRRC